MWTSCVAINTQVWTAEGTIPWSVNIFCVTLLFHVLHSWISKHLILAKVLQCHQRTLLSSVLFVVVHFYEINISNKSGSCMLVAYKTPMTTHILREMKANYKKRRGWVKMCCIALDSNRLLLASKWTKRSYAFGLWKETGLCNVSAKHLLKNILKIIALFFAKMIIYSTWTKLPAI